MTFRENHPHVLHFTIWIWGFNADFDTSSDPVTCHSKHLFYAAHVVNGGKNQWIFPIQPTLLKQVRAKPKLIDKKQQHNPLMKRVGGKTHIETRYDGERKTERRRGKLGGVGSEFHVAVFRQSLFFLCRAATSRRGPLKSGLLNYPDGVRETLSWLQVALWYRACWPFPHHTGPLCASLNAAWRKQHKGQPTDGSPFPKLFIWLWHV